MAMTTDYSVREENRTEGDKLYTDQTWLKFICKSKEKDIMEVIKWKPELAEQMIAIECLAAGVDEKCNCCYEFESLKYLTENLDQFLNLVETGRCPHVTAFLSEDKSAMIPSQTISRKCSSCLQLPPSLKQNASSRDINTHKGVTIKNMQFYSRDTDDSKRIETRYIKANNEYKFRDPLDFNLLRQAWMSLFLPRDRVWKCFGIVKAEVTVIHIAAALGYSKLVRKILKITNQSPHSTRHYQLLPLYHSVINLKIDITKSLIKIIDFGNRANFARYYVLAVMRNNVLILSIFVKGVFNRRHINIYGRTLISYQVEMGSDIAVKYKCSQSLKYLCSTSICKKFRARSYNITFHGIPLARGEKANDNLKNMFIDNDLRSLQGLLNLPEGQSTLLRYAVFYGDTFLLISVEKLDRTDMAQILISDAMQRERILLSSATDLNFLTQAVLNNSVAMLHILLKGYKCLRPKDTPVGRHYYTSHTWAVVLGFKECVAVLRNASISYQEEIVSRLPPLVAVFHHKVDSYRNNKTDLINMLLKEGWSLLCESDKGITPLYMALQSKKYEYVRPLLNFGVDPFLGINCLPVFVSRRLLAEFLYANVDICKRRYGISLLLDILHRDTRFQEFRPDLSFLIRHAHSIPKDDMARLSYAKEVPSIPDNIKNDIDVFLRNPRTLETMARNSLRRHYGLGISHFLDNQVPHLPEQLKRFISLEDCLQPYLQQNHKTVYTRQLTDF